MRTVGSYEAKTHLPQLLDEVASGGTILITRHGAPVAELRPAAPLGRTPAADAIAGLRTARRGARLDGLSIRELIDEGRA